MGRILVEKAIEVERLRHDEKFHFAFYSPKFNTPKLSSLNDFRHDN